MSDPHLVVWTIIISSLCQISALVCALLLLKYYVEAKQADLERRAQLALREWLEAPEEGKPSKAALLVQAVGEIVGTAAARSLVGTVTAQESHVARGANTAADLLQAQQNPLLALLKGGRRGKGAAMEHLAELLGPMLQNMGKSRDNGGQASLFDVNKYG